jgi:methionine-S-sulfoxide reductase
VVRTRVGYCGGTSKNPTYESIGDHSETIQIDFDPSKITYRQLCEMYWDNRNICGRPSSRQYKPWVFYENDEQKKIATETRDATQAKRKEKLTAEIAPLGVFTIAEDYHQKYELRLRPDYLKALTAAYPKPADLMNSTVAARLNSYLSGHGTLADLEKEIDGYGLSKELRDQLIECVKRN